MFQLTGPHRQRAGEKGKWPPPPLSRLTGVVIISGDRERTVWKQPVSPWFLSSQGIVPGGLLAVLADMALGSAIGGHTPPRTPFSTSEMSLNFVRPATVESGELTAEGRLIEVTGRLAFSEARITDAAGLMVAHSTCRCVLGEQVPAASDVPAADDEAAVDAYIDSLQVPQEPVEATPDPLLRPVVGEVLSRETWQARTGLQILQDQIAGDLPMPPIHHLLGVRPTSAAEGQVEFAMPASGWLNSGLATVQGGCLAFLAYSALASAIQTTTDVDTAHVPVDLKVNFLRPVYPDPEVRDLTARGTVVHRGRTLSVADATVTSPEGKLVVVARGTSMFLPGIPAWGVSLERP